MRFSWAFNLFAGGVFIFYVFIYFYAAAVVVRSIILRSKGRSEGWGKKWVSQKGKEKKRKKEI